LTLFIGCSNNTGSTDAQHEKRASFIEGQDGGIPRTAKSDADRIAHVHSIARLVEDFKQKVGHYPYEEAFLNPTPGFAPVPATVNITRQQLPEQYQYPPPGVSGVVYTHDQFRDYLQELLGRDVELPVNTEPAPRFYQYHFDGRHYYVSAELFESTSATRQIAPERHKYQVSSTSVPERKILRFQDIE